MEIPIVREVLEESNARAAENRERFRRDKVFVVNLMSSPGAGKTELLRRTIQSLQQQSIRCAVIEGDITSTLDSERLAPLAVPVVQANTEPFGGDCHIGSHLVQAALKHLDKYTLDILFIENVGNLVCPAEFDLGEDRKVVVLSLPEGTDKPLKYPLMFRECNLCLANKIDLLPYLDVSLDDLIHNVHQINGPMPVFPVSAKTGAGFEAWIEWLLNGVAEKRKIV